MFNPSRAQVRRFFCEAWQKHQERRPLLGAEVAAANIVARHPEYHELLSSGEAAVELEWTPEGGQMNPFLHLSLHLAVHEQLSIDQPSGICAAFTALCARLDTHAAEHAILECLGETLWNAQRQGRPMDSESYLQCVRRAAS